MREFLRFVYIVLSCGIVISIVIDIRTKNDGRRDGATIRRCLVIGSRNGKATGLTSRSYSRDLASSSCLVFPLVRDVSPTPSFLGSFVRSKGSFPLCLSDRLARIAVRLSLSNLPLTFTRAATHLYSTYARVYIYVRLSLYKSIETVLSVFVRL